MAEQQGQQGLLIKDTQGNVYFLRPEVLAMTKVSPDEIKSAPPEFKKHVDALSGGDVSGYALQSSLQPVGGLRVRVANPGLAGFDPGRVASTTMCPW